MATIGLVPLILMLITRTTSVSLAQIPTHPPTTLVGSASPCVVLLITRSGDLNLATASLRGVGHSGDVWSEGVTARVNNTYHFHFYSEEILPSIDDLRWLSYTVRCLTN